MVDSQHMADALPSVHTVLRYLRAIEGKGILTGQHTQTMEQEELRHIER